MIHKLKMSEDKLYKPIPIGISKSDISFNDINIEKNEFYGEINSEIHNFNINDEIKIIKYKIKKDKIKRTVSKFKLRLQYLMVIFILISIIADTFIEMLYGFVNIFGMADNVIILILLKNLFKYCINEDNFYGKKLSLEIVVITFFGFILKVFSMVFCLIKEEFGLFVAYAIIIGARTIFLSWLLPFTCRY